MRSRAYYRTRTLVRALFWLTLTLLIVAGIAGLLYLVDHVNYMGAGKWCFHSLIVCDFGGK